MERIRLTEGEEKESLGFSPPFHLRSLSKSLAPLRFLSVHPLAVPLLPRFSYKSSLISLLFIPSMSLTEYPPMLAARSLDSREMREMEENEEEKGRKDGITHAAPV
mmetsp:Transcript_14036/g.28106  ORF Transcript_14036/g.28106 Transcript_14036/m.28106 type:complete len:106 (+) Transcript_14036:1449-1766(+)